MITFVTWKRYDPIEKLVTSFNEQIWFDYWIESHVLKNLEFSNWLPVPGRPMEGRKGSGGWRDSPNSQNPCIQVLEHDFRGIVHPGIASHHPAHASALRDNLVQETVGIPDLKFLFRFALFVEKSSSKNPAPTVLFDFQIEDHVMRHSGTWVKRKRIKRKALHLFWIPGQKGHHLLRIEWIRINHGQG